MARVAHLRTSFAKAKSELTTLFPGLLACGTVAMAAQFLSEHYGAPAMLMALLLGMSFRFLSSEERCAKGIQFSSKVVLHVAVALLGARISVDVLLNLGGQFVGLIVLAVVSTMVFALAFSRLLGRGWRFALITGGSVAICGASAAVAVASVLPKNENSGRTLSVTVMSVTILSTLAMIIYPAIAGLLELDSTRTGVFLGGSIHDVAQVVGAGYSVSEEVGDTATLVKLIRVTMLAPLVLFLSVTVWILYRHREDQAKPRLLPKFVLAFLGLAAAGSLGIIPTAVIEGTSTLSRVGLLMAIAAVGMRTLLGNIKTIGRSAILLIIAETCFLGVWVLIGVHLIR